MKAAWFLLFTIAAAAQTTPSDQSGAVSGTVTDAVTKLPLKKTIVTANYMGNPGRGNPTPPSATTTDSSGGFTVNNLTPGKYRLMFDHQNYPQSRMGGATKNVEVKSGETAGPVNVELIPGASVSGRFVDEDGDPIQGCNVEVHPAKNPDQGVNMTGSSGSNEDGEYRAYGIAAGKYILAGRCGRQVFQPRPFSAGPDPPESKAYPMLYYPLVSDAKSAQVIELTAGTDKSGVDFQMNPAAVTQVRGTFSPAGADWHGKNLNVQLTSLQGAFRGGTGVRFDQQKGTFEARQVFPGPYILVAFNFGNDDDRIGAWQRIDVGDQPIELALELRHAADVSGKAEIEGSTSSTNPVTPAQIHVDLVPQSQQFGMPNSNAQASEDGTFTLKGVLPGPWRLMVNGPGVYLKSAWLGSTDVTHTAMDVSGGAAGALKIVVSTNTATIRGSAPAGYLVMSQRVDDESPFPMMRNSGVDQNGQYTLTGLAPGKYRVVVTEGGGPMPDEGWQEVTVQEGETVMVDLKAPGA